jgi:spore coat polysaccharide biosynthesis protein SpsF
MQPIGGTVALKVVAVVQARMSSARLPGKVLREVRGRPLLAYLIDRLRRCNVLDGVVIATSTGRDDDPIAAFARTNLIDCHRGSLDDVAFRLLSAARAAGADALVRISGDSPLIDPAIVDRAVDIYRRERPDLATNVQRRTFPKGQSVEVIAMAALERAHRAMTSAAEREHVTLLFYAHPERFRIAAFESGIARGDLQLSVDTEEDFARFAAIIERLGEPAASHDLASIIAAADAIDRVAIRA